MAWKYSASFSIRNYFRRRYRLISLKGLIFSMRLALLFIGLPLLELYILIKIGSYLGAFLTIALIIFSGILGLLLARFEGLRTLHQIRQNLSQGILPAE